MYRFQISLCVVLIGASLAATAAAETPLTFVDEDAWIPSSTRTGASYCQAPDYPMVYQMSSGQNAEFGDDLPNALAGETITDITLWVGEWSAAWQDPLGVRINFYDEQCPPAMTPTTTIEIDWADWTKTLVYNGSARVYEVIAPLPQPVTISAGMSIGVTVLIDWGTSEPFAGICATPFNVSYGASEAYLDGMNWGYVRWTSIAHFTTLVQDLAFCLGLESTAAPVVAEAATGPRLQAAPNPFATRTTLRFSMERPGRVRVRVHDVTGRLVATPLDADRAAGDVRVDWDGRGDDGRRVASGVYTVQLEANGETRTAKVILVD